MGLLHTFKSLFGQQESAQPTAPIEAAPGDRRLRPRANPKPGTRALIIDDSPTIALALRRMLDSAGVHSLTAPDAEQGLDLARKERPDLIFLDIVLPGMNGFSALRQLRREEHGRATPVIMISGNEKAAAQFHGARIGADDFMRKPFSRHDLFTRIESLLDVERVPRRRLEDRPGARA